MSNSDAFSESLTSAIKSVLHVLEQLNALKGLIDRVLTSKKDGSVIFEPPLMDEWTGDAGEFVSTGLAWTYPILHKPKGAKGRPRRIGTAWFWCRLAPPRCTSQTVDTDSVPFFSVEVTSGKLSDDDVDGYMHPSDWADENDVKELRELTFALPLLASGVTRGEDGGVEWAAFAYRLSSLTAPTDVNRDLIQPAIALANLLVAPGGSR